MKDQFTNKIGYVLAAAGAAVGLGNIWRFPYLAAKYGGGIFLLTYLVLVLTFGYALLIAENGIGRMTGKGPIGAFRNLCAGQTGLRKFVRFGGWINALVPLIILPYYCVIGGWVTKYVVTLAANPAATFSKDAFVEVDGKQISASANYFTNFITSTWEPLVYFLVFIAIIIAVVALGVGKGVERFNKILMPVFFLMIIGICVYCIFLPNAGDGFAYYLKPDFSKFSYMTVINAMGQLFFSVCIAMGISITYGSYMRKEDNLISNVNQVELFDTAAAFLAGMLIIPAVVAFGGREAAESAGVGLMFITLPQVFAEFAGGRIVGIVFFIMVLFAAVTSALALLETNVQTISQEAGISRSKAIAIGTLEIVGIGTITLLGYSVLSGFHPLAFIDAYKDKDILDSLDFLSNSVMMPIAAIFTTVLVVAVLGLERFSNEVKQAGAKWRREYVFRFCMNAVVIPGLLVLLLHTLGILS